MRVVIFLFLGHHLLGSALACCPFPNDTEAALETIRPQPAPELGAIPAAACPFPFQPR